MNQIRQLAHITRPFIGSERINEIRGEGDGCALIRKLVSIVFGQHQDVVATLTQRRRAHGQYVEAVIQVFAETAGRNFCFQITVSRCHDAHIDFNRTRGTDRVHGFFLQYPQQLDLHVQREIADLIQEQGAAMGQFKASDTIRQSASEGTFAVAEQLTFHQFFGYGGAIQRHKISLSARRLIMQSLSDELLARTRFAIHENGCGRIRDRFDQLADLAHRRAIANDGIRLSHGRGSVLGRSRW